MPRRSKKVVEMAPRRTAKGKKYDDVQTAADLEAALRNLPDNYLMCRDLKHAWDVHFDFFVNPKTKEVERKLRCIRCDMIRVEKYVQTSNGLDKIRNIYGQPEGYGIHGVPRGVKPSSIVKGVQFERAMEKVAARARKQGHA